MKKEMITTELKPLILNLSDEDENEEEGENLSPAPKDDDLVGDDNGGDKDGFGLDDDMIEAPGEGEF